MGNSRSGRKPVPTALHAMRGNPSQKKLNKNEPKPGKMKKIDPPTYLKPEAKAEWKRVAPVLQRLGLFTELDAPALSAYCESYARYVEAVKKLSKQELVITYPTGAQAPNHLLGIINSALKTMQTFMCEFGMTPSSRSKLSIEPPADDDPRMKLL